MLNLEIESTDKASSVVNNVGRTLVEKALRLGSKEIDVTNNSFIHDAYKDLYLSEKECEAPRHTAGQYFKSTVGQ